MDTEKKPKSRNKVSKKNEKVSENTEKHQEIVKSGEKTGYANCGRRTTYTKDTADYICEKLSKGIPLAEICREEDMPAVRTVSAWKEAHEDFAAAFARAREDGFDQIAADCLAIADETHNDSVDTENGPRANAEWIARSKLRVETRLKLLAKWDPKRYGERMQLAGDPDAPLMQMTDEQLAIATARLEMKIKGSK
jgi:hypothetical protein